MAWCTNCDQNREIEHRIRGESTAVPTRTERYNRDGDRIGYEEGEAYETTIDSVPVCRWCNTRFEFPRAQSKEQYFNAKKRLAVESWRAKRPKTDDKGCWVPISIFAGCLIAGFISTAWIEAESWVPYVVGGAVILGIPVVIVWAVVAYRKDKARGKTITITPEMQDWQEKLRQWESLPYTEANYQYLRDWRP